MRGSWLPRCPAIREPTNPDLRVLRDQNPGRPTRVLLMKEAGSWTTYTFGRPAITLAGCNEDEIIK